ncbi:hypothetical protein EYV94_05055 [Puteibacter caeruleilacunae]|nr:hypothetical protein EYV94_05055 [Puteibacter caeruleilacunae]
MPKQQTIQFYLKKLIKSPIFAKSVVNKELLKYLIDQTLKEEIPKEFQIEHDVFGKDANSTKEKNVRIYISNLRKKLTEYYKEEGLQDEIRFEIPKGSYEVIFHVDRVALVKTQIKKQSLAILAISVLLFATSIILFSSKDRPKASRHFIWKEIYHSDFPTMIVLGDHYFFRLRSVIGGMATVRYSGINSDDDLLEFIEQHPENEKDIAPMSQTYINKQAPFGLYKIMTLLGGGQAEIDLRYSSEFKWEDVENHNLIFIGSYKTQNQLRQVHEKLGIDYEINPTILHYHVNDSIINFDARSDDGMSIEYASFTRFVTSDGRNVISFMCNSDVGNMAVLKYMSKEENLKRLEDMADALNTDNVKGVFEVRAQRYTEFEINIIRFDTITEDTDKIWPY